MALYDAAHKYLSVEENVDDELNITGKRFAFQLKKLDDQQRLIAEKLWADIIFHGAQGKLELDCTIKFPSQNVQQLQDYHNPYNTVPLKASTFVSQHYSNNQAISRQPDLPGQEGTQSSYDFLKKNLSDFILLKPGDTNYNDDV